MKSLETILDEIDDIAEQECNCPDNASADTPLCRACEAAHIWSQIFDVAKSSLIELGGSLE